jgi:hypothetical protein
MSVLRALRLRSHTGDDLGRHSIIAQHVAHVAQSAGLALHDEMPKRDACLRHQDGTQLSGFARCIVPLLLVIELRQSSNRRLERASEPAKSRGLLLGEFVLEKIDSRWIVVTCHLLGRLCVASQIDRHCFPCRVRFRSR